MKTHYSITEAAEEIGISPRALRNRIDAGTVKAERIGARVFALTSKEVERLRPLGRLKTGPKPFKRSKQQTTSRKSEEKGEQS